MVADSTRRELLKAASTAGIVGIAGCTGGGGGGGGSGDGGGGDGDGGDGDGGDAEYSMTVATPYTEEALNNYMPMMMFEFKDNVESETNGQVQVELGLGGTLGVGTKLAQKVQQGTIEGAQFSISNFSPFASAVDLINLPYFAGTNQKFVNLITSDVWRENIRPKVRENGYEVAYYVLNDPRCLATGPAVEEAPTTPAKFEGLKHRVPGSEMLQQAWRLAGGNPTPIDWGETAQAMEEGVADTLHTSFNAHPAFGFTETVRDEVFVRAVQDAQVIALNREWLQSLPEDLRESVRAAGQTTFEANLDALEEYRTNSYEILRENDVEFHDIGESELQQWRDAMGYQRSEWDQFKKDLAGDMETFEQFEEAANTKGDYSPSPLSIPE
jgi:TRAP-type C4-dicarboxylate transport system substrate-binding protein